MTKEQLLQEIKDLLYKSPFPPDQIEAWIQSAETMDAKELVEFLTLLKERLEISTKANQLLISIAEQAGEEGIKESGEIPKELYIMDMKAEDAAEIFRTGLIKLAQNKKIDIFVQVDAFFRNTGEAGEDVSKTFNDAIRAMTANNEPFGQEKVTIGRFMRLYNVFKIKGERKEIDRINFINNNEEARELKEEERKILLKLLKLYDFLINPSAVDIAPKVEVLTKIGRIKKISRPAELKQKFSTQKSARKADSRASQNKPSGLILTSKKGISKSENKSRESQANQAEKKSQLEKLQKELEKHAAGSFERKIIQGQIDKLKRQQTTDNRQEAIV